MKRLTTIIFLALITIIACKKDNPEPEIKEAIYSTFEGSIGQNDNSTIVSFDNNLIICGNTNFDGYWTLIKITKQGEELWRKEFPGESWAINEPALVEAENGDLFVCGETNRNGIVSKLDILLVKSNLNGDTLWTKTYGGSENDYAQNIITTSDGNILISGWSGTDSIALGDINLLKLDYNGDTLWSRCFADPGHQGAYHLLETKNGEYLISGGINKSGNLSELYLLKVDADGTKLWEKTLGPPTGKIAHSVIELSNNNLVICGYDQGGESENKQLIVVKTDPWGDLIWEKDFGNDSTHESGNSIKLNLDETYTIVGSYHNNSGWHLKDIVLLKIDKDGNQIWYKRFGDVDEDERSRNLIKDTNDDNLITGNYDWSGPIFLTRSDKDGNFK